eukprot:7391383-Prymnesium_polylepis.2
MVREAGRVSETRICGCPGRIWALRRVPVPLFCLTLKLDPCVACVLARYGRGGKGPSPTPPGFSPGPLRGLKAYLGGRLHVPRLVWGPWRTIVWRCDPFV